MVDPHQLKRHNYPKPNTQNTNNWQKQDQQNYNQNYQKQNTQNTNNWQNQNQQNYNQNYQKQNTQNTNNWQNQNQQNYNQNYQKQNTQNINNWQNQNQKNYNQNYQQQEPQTIKEEPKKEKYILKRKLKHWVQDIFLITLILLNILDFFEILTGDLDFAKKILSWICLGYLLYSVNIAKVIFGKEFKEYDQGFRIELKQNDITIILLIAYFLLIFKNLVYSASVIINQEVSVSEITKTFLLLLHENAQTINSITLLAGGFMVFIISIIMTLRYTITDPSILSIIHGPGAPTSDIKKMFIRFIAIYLILIGFYIIVFNFFMEWLAFAVDSTLLIIGLILYVFVILRGKKKEDTESFLSKVGNFGSDFYQRFIELFYTKKGFMLGLTGILILHLLVELGIFIIPYLTGIKDSLYFSILEQINIGAHEPIINRLSNDLMNYPLLIDKIAIIGIYILNIIAVILILITPAYMWYKSFLSKGINIPRYILALLFSSLTALVIGRIFNLVQIASPQRGLAGVDIHTTTIQPLLGLSPLMILIICSVIFVMVSLTTKELKTKEHFIILSAIIINLVILIYITLFAWDLLIFYLHNLQHILSAASQAGPLTSYVNYFYTLMFMIMTMVFYITSFIFFVRETITELRLSKSQ